MEFSVHRDTLLGALARARGVVEKKTTMPILTNVLVQSAGSDLITIKATDLEVSMVGQYLVDVAKPGAFCLPASKFFDVIKSLPTGNVTLRFNPDNRKVEIKGDKGSQFQLFTVAADEFPTLPTADDVDLVEVDADNLRQALAFVLPATAVDDPRIYLNSIYLEGRGSGMVNFVATDGHKLSVIARAMDLPLEQGKGLIIPRKAALEMSKILDDMKPDAVVKLGFNDTTGFFMADRFTFTYRLIESSYPAYQMIVPRNHEREVQVSLVELKELLGRVSVLAMEKNARVRIDITADTLEASYSNSEYGSSRQSIPVQLDGDPITLGFTISTFTDILGIFPHDQLILRIVNVKTPMSIVCDGFEDGFGVVMPLEPDEVETAY